MPLGKRKLDNFDPNKSDSDDENFDPTQDKPRKTSKKSGTTPLRKSSKKRKTKYRGSDVSEDDISDSLLEDSFSEEEEEDVDIDETTGRRRRTVTRKAISYQEDSESGDPEDESAAESENESEPPIAKPGKSKVIKLKVKPAIHTERLTRATNSEVVSDNRRDTISEAMTAPISRRNTRAHSEDAGDLIELSNSGRHARVVRSSRSPEVEARTRSTRGSKGVKKPASVIAEESNESASQQVADDADMDMEEVQEEKGEEEEEEEEEDDTVRVEPDDDAGEESQNDGEAEMPDIDGDEEGRVPANTADIVAGDDGDDDDDDEDEGPISRTRGSRANVAADTGEAEIEDDIEATGGGRRLRKRTTRKSGVEQSSDFEPDQNEESAEENVSESDSSPKKGKNDDNNHSPTGRGRADVRGKSKSSRTSRLRGRASDGEEEEDLDPDEIAEELQDLKPSGRRRRPRQDPDLIYDRPTGRRERKPVDYSIKPMDQIYAADEDAEETVATPSRGARGRRNGASQPWERNLYTTFGPFGGGGGPTPVIGGPWGTGATGGVDSDSSDDENMQRPNIGGNVGMTPTSAIPPVGLLPGIGQAFPPDQTGAVGGTPANLGKIKSQKALADADPLGVDQNVDFSKVGGLEDHIDKLKEMVQMPLLYPELFLKLHVTPPRGVLFHGPPGTGKTLVARALAASVGSGGRKVTFYMRKGADALSKWVGEAERQLRLLFEEARKTQPSIIFFDEIDGLAPVRSSKQEQIHASIVSTLLALMDGMDGRGQVIVIGATNRPDNIDPALRRPGRFDREFYFPLPDIEGRRSIINIHTQDWGVDEAFKDSLAHLTKGYGGADLRALCTEAALNAIQRTYPQIYTSNEKLIVDPDKIKITAKDFMLSIKKMIPSSERATSSGAAPLPRSVEPLLRDQLRAIEAQLDNLIPVAKKVTALQEAMYEQYNDSDQGFARETLQQDFEKSRVFRPRLLVNGLPGMGQSYLGAAILHHFEGLHVQTFDLATIYNDSAKSPEATIVQLFSEVRRHKPSVIYLPGIDTWYTHISEAAITTFLGLLRSIPPTDPVLVLGISENEPDRLNQDMLKNLFGYSVKNRFLIGRPSEIHREEFFSNITSYVRKAPKDFPEPLNRKKRKLEVLEIAPPPPPKAPTKEEIKAQKKRDHQLLNVLKMSLQPIMDQINRKYRKFRTPVIPPHQIQYLYQEQDPDFVRPDIPQFRPFEIGKDRDGVTGLRETASGKFFYNLETTTIEERLSNGFYARPRDFLADIRSLAKDSKNIGDKDRTLKANELLTNVEVDIATIEQNPTMSDCENVYLRQLQRAKDREEKYRKRAAEDSGLAALATAEVPTGGREINPEDQPSGPLTLGVSVPKEGPVPLSTPFANQIPPVNPLTFAHGLRNGSSVPSRASDGDIQMGGTDPSLNGHNSQAMLPPSQQQQGYTRGQSNPSSNPHGGNTQQSQRSGFQAIAADTVPHSLVNDASTTTSGKKSDPSNRSSSGWGTQLTNGRADPAFSSGGKAAEDYEIPDTQRESQRETQDSQQEGISAGINAEEQWTHSQAHGLTKGTSHYDTPTTSAGSQSSPLFQPSHLSRTAGLANVLSDGADVRRVSTVDQALTSSSQASSQKDLIIDETYVQTLQEQLTRRTSGCSIEQLEQINRELMDKLWQMRGEWNRSKVATALIAVFNETITDIEQMQKVLQASQDEE